MGWANLEVCSSFNPFSERIREMKIEYKYIYYACMLLNVHMIMEMIKIMMKMKERDDGILGRC